MRKHKWVYLGNLCFVMSSYISILLTCVFSCIYKGLDLKPWTNTIKVCKSVNRLRKPWKITKNNNKKHDFTNLGSHLVKVMQIMFFCLFLRFFLVWEPCSHFCTLLLCFFMVLSLSLYKCMRKHKWVYLSNLCFVMSSYISILLTCVFSCICKGLDLKPWKNTIKVCKSVNRLRKPWKITKTKKNMISQT